MTNSTHPMPKCSGGDSFTGVVTVNSKAHTGNHDWEELCKDGKRLVLDGTVFTIEATDGILPDGPREVTRIFKAPLVRGNREVDNWVPWAAFQSNGAESV